VIERLRTLGIGESCACLGEHLLLVLVHVDGVGPRRLGLGRGVDLTRTQLPGNIPRHPWHGKASAHDNRAPVYGLQSSPRLWSSHGHDVSYQTLQIGIRGEGKHPVLIQTIIFPFHSHESRGVCTWGHPSGRGRGRPSCSAPGRGGTRSAPGTATPCGPRWGRWCATATAGSWPGAEASPPPRGSTPSS
jgi:hypothetical protein